MALSEAGLPYPQGSTYTPGEGVNFSLWARTATAVELLLFDDVDDTRPSRVIRLDRRANRSFSYWHVRVPDLGPGQVYGWRVHGPHVPAHGLRHDPEALLLDPYAHAVAFPRRYDRYARGDLGASMKSVVVDLASYDWEGDAPLGRPFAQTIIYEAHVKGLTAHPSSGLPPETRGTYAGLIEKIPYLKQLGITAVELMPILAFDPADAPPGVVNYWGYAPVSFFAPHPAYARAKDPQGVLDEVRDMIKALHRAGIEVILDVVYNHTAEGDVNGPTFCWRGLDNETYYILERGDPSRYANYSGCGNTLNANESIVRRMIVHSLHFWVSEMHVDGFRFDLASIFTRDAKGEPMKDPPLIWSIESDPVLARTKLIAEAWDAAGLYQVGSFTGDRWREWNGRYRDDVRRFFRGDDGVTARLPDRLLASPDLYSARPQEVEHSVNFVTCHDGFTLNDLVSYDRKHNEANHEGNRDGSNDEHSWNHGVEGPTDDPEIERLRNRQVKNLLATTLIAMGVPMIGMGDEVRRTQHGNNNAYCQDNELSWMDWSLLEKHADVLRFTACLCRLRLGLDMTQVDHGLPLAEFLERSRVTLHGVRLHEPDLADDSHSLALTVRGIGESRLIHAILNAWREPLDFQLPPVPAERPWRRVIDTTIEGNECVVDLAEAPVVSSSTYRAGPRSVVLLAASLR
ncbi:MAG: glycogen debranching protein GlgX [Sandaracinaceae bacterium]|nr:glycogen debranching protein GlgX [Sandaracinaceae bacterium]